MKRQIEIEDTLEERTQAVIEEVQELLENFLKSNPDAEECPCLHNDLDYDGSVHGIIDSSVPVYTGEIRATWFLHQNKLESAYEDAGLGDNPMDNNGMVAIYCYIEQRVSEWYQAEAEDLFEEWNESKKSIDSVTIKNIQQRQRS